MANNSTISVAYKIEDVGGSLKKLSLDAEGLKNIFEKIVNETEKLKDQAIDFTAIATNIDSVGNTLTSLQDTLRGLTDAYSAQVEVETQLAVNMRNTMGAREEEI